jgi:hypothetical protein
MAYNFLACDRDQAFLLPPDLREWLPADHLAWFVLDAVDHPADPAALPRGPRLPGAGRQPGTRPRDDRTLPSPPPAGLAGVLVESLKLGAAADRANRTQ